MSLTNNQVALYRGNFEIDGEDHIALLLIEGTNPTVAYPLPFDPSVAVVVALTLSEKGRGVIDRLEGITEFSLNADVDPLVVDLPELH